MHLRGFQQNPVMLTLLFYLLTSLLGHDTLSQVTFVATKLCQSTLAAHSKCNKQLAFPGIFFFPLLFFTLHKKPIAGFLSHSQDLLEIIAISHTYYILKKIKRSTDKERRSFWTLSDTEAKERETSFHRQRLAKGNHTHTRKSHITLNKTTWPHTIQVRNTWEGMEEELVWSLSGFFWCKIQQIQCYLMGSYWKEVWRHSSILGLFLNNRWEDNSSAG